MVKVTIDNKEISVPEGTSISKAARSAGIYIPVLCSHPDLPPFHSIKLSNRVYQGAAEIVHDPGKSMGSINGCGMCLVQQDGVDLPISSCESEVSDGMKIHTGSGTIRKKRQQHLMKILTRHPHACLTCDLRDGCTRNDCPNGVPVEERCCDLLGRCELQKVADYVGILPETPRYRFEDLPKIKNDPLYLIDYNLCISCGRCVTVCQSVKGVGTLGAVIPGTRKGELVVGKVYGPFLTDEECRYCSSCVEVCPTGALQDKKKPRLQGESELVPCKTGCPGEVNIPLYLRLIDQGKYQQAAEVNTAKLPLASVLGKVCFHPCEIDCRRGLLSEYLLGTKEPARIRLLKDFVMSRYTPPASIPAEPATGKKVAVIGGGPAGLTAAYFLALKGHDVTIYEAHEEVGGMLRYGIPRYRLPKEILEKDIHRILITGIKIKTYTALGKDFTLKSLFEKGISAAFLAVGLSKGKQLSIPGLNAPVFGETVINGIDFLHKVSKNTIRPDHFESKSVVVIGGGNVAIDAARCAVRLKAKNITVVCLERRNEMPAYVSEITQAVEENIRIMNEWGIDRIEFSGKNGHLHDIVLKKCRSVFNEQGDFAPLYDGSNKNTVSADAVLICIGQEIDPGFLAACPGNGKNFSITDNGTIIVNEDSLETTIPGVFAGGDIVSGPSSVIDAVGAGRKAARSIDKYLGGDGCIDTDQPPPAGIQEETMFIGGEAEFSCLSRVSAPLLEPEVRIMSFDPVEITLSEDAARAEAHRCLKCDLRLLFSANPHPPEKFFKFNAETIDSLPEGGGVIQLMDENKEVFSIKGCKNIRDSLLSMFEKGKNAAFFTYEFDPMYTKRENELIQQHLQKYGRFPVEDKELDDLY